MTRRILLDCTFISHLDPNSGIQRVVRNIIKNSGDAAKGLRVSVEPVLWNNGNFYIASLSPKPSQRKPLGVNRVARKAMKAVLPQAYHAWVETLLPLSQVRPLSAPKPVEFGPQDALVLLDSSWHIPYWREVETAKAFGAKIGFVLYDLIPVTHPQFCDSGIIESFSGWLVKAASLCDYFLAISETTKDEFYRVFSPSHLDIRGESFRLGANLERVSKSQPIRGSLKAVLSEPTFISVGTIEPRKNHGYVLKAFEDIWRSGGNVNLCLIGKVGWHNDALVKRIKTHTLFKKRLWMFNDLNDTELDYAYRHASATIIASIQEGFGLPIIEALNNNLPVLASDIPVFREVGGNHCTYFKTDSPESLVKAVETLLNNGGHLGKRVGDFSWISWQQSTIEFLQKVLELANQD